MKTQLIKKAPIWSAESSYFLCDFIYIF